MMTLLDWIELDVFIDMLFIVGGNPWAPNNLINIMIQRQRFDYKIIIDMFNLCIWMHFFHTQFFIFLSIFSIFLMVHL